MYLSAPTDNVLNTYDGPQRVKEAAQVSLTELTQREKQQVNLEERRKHAGAKAKKLQKSVANVSEGRATRLEDTLAKSRKGYTLERRGLAYDQRKR